MYPVYADCNLYAENFYYAANEALVSKAAGVQLDATEAAHYETIGFSGAGFTPGETVRAEYRQNGAVVDSPRGTTNASNFGEIEGTISFGNVTPAGSYDVVFIGETSGAEHSAPLTIIGEGEGNGGGTVDDAAVSAAPAANIDRHPPAQTARSPRPVARTSLRSPSRVASLPSHSAPA